MSQAKSSSDPKRIGASVRTVCLKHEEDAGRLPGHSGPAFEKKDTCERKWGARRTRFPRFFPEIWKLAGMEAGIKMLHEDAETPAQLATAGWAAWLAVSTGLAGVAGTRATRYVMALSSSLVATGRRLVNTALALSGFSFASDAHGTGHGCLHAVPPGCSMAGKDDPRLDVLEAAE
jgi:hypothetical protein